MAIAHLLRPCLPILVAAAGLAACGQTASTDRPMLRIPDAALESYEGVIEAPPGVDSFETTTTIVEAMPLP
jgi:hypothetical protein